MEEARKNSIFGSKERSCAKAVKHSWFIMNRYVLFNLHLINTKPSEILKFRRKSCAVFYV